VKILKPISAIITAAGKNRRMRQDLKDRGLPYSHKLLLEINGEPVLTRTVRNVLDMEVGECLVVLGHYQEELIPVLDEIDDGRLRIILNSDREVELSQTLLNGVINAVTDYCLCVAGDQPSVTTSTLKTLVDTLFSSVKPENTISILARRAVGQLESAKGLGMPFACHRNILMRFLPRDADNLNPILRKMILEDVKFYGVPHQEEVELLNINRYDDYLKVLELLKKE
jgi:molybdenum cofactor cytidylyltransferase